MTRLASILQAGLARPKVLRSSLCSLHARLGWDAFAFAPMAGRDEVKIFVFVQMTMLRMRYRLANRNTCSNSLASVKTALQLHWLWIMDLSTGSANSLVHPQKSMAGQSKKWEPIGESKQSKGARNAIFGATKK
jgi:hypothetical protein